MPRSKGLITLYTGAVMLRLWTILFLSFPALILAQSDPDPLDLERRTTLPAPISVSPSQFWDGIDGQWSSFTLRLGTPSQFVRVFPSTASQQTWTVNATLCVNTETFGNDTNACSDSRGWLFNKTSSTFEERGWYNLWIEENLGYQGQAFYGYDTIGLGDAGQGGPVLENMTLGVLWSDDFHLGIFGLHPKPTNFTTFNEPSPSYMTTLKEQNYIPSLSFGYTAGNPYTFTKVPASLTLGGYDSNKFAPNGLSFEFAPDNERELVVSLESVRASDATEKDVDLLPEPIYVFIDSTVPELWLPVEACKRFEDEFGLTYDNATELYLINDSLHDKLLSRNASVSFAINKAPGASPTVEIALPYLAFDLVAKPPYRDLTTESKYFPLRRAQNETQYTLGRTFLQEAYLMVDWERQNFSVSQCVYSLDTDQHLVPIFPLGFDNSTAPADGSDSKKPLSTGAIAGIAVGGTVLLAAIVAFFVVRRVRKHHRARINAAVAATAAATAAAAESSPGYSDDKRGFYGSDSNPTTLYGGVEHTVVFAKAELPAQPFDPNEADSTPVQSALGSDGGTLTLPSGSPGVDTITPLATPGLASARPAEVENSERPVFEMEGDLPSPSEAGGRVLTEKEAMLVREARYNGIGASPTTPTTATGHSPQSVTTPIDADLLPSALFSTPTSPMTANNTTAAAAAGRNSARSRPSPLSGTQVRLLDSRPASNTLVSPLHTPSSLLPPASPLPSGQPSPPFSHLALRDPRLVESVITHPPHTPRTPRTPGTPSSWGVLRGSAGGSSERGAAGWREEQGTSSADGAEKRRRFSYESGTGDEDESGSRGAPSAVESGYSAEGGRRGTGIAAGRRWSVHTDSEGDDEGDDEGAGTNFTTATGATGASADTTTTTTSSENEETADATNATRSPRGNGPFTPRGNGEDDGGGLRDVRR